MSKKPFNKFIVKEESGAQKKERIRQEKKQVRKETQAYFEEKKRFARHGYIARTENRQENTPPSSFQKRSGGNAAGPASRTPVKKQGEGSAHGAKRGNDQFKQPVRRSSADPATSKPAGNKLPIKKQSPSPGSDGGSRNPQPLAKKQALTLKPATGQRSAEPAKKQEHTSSMPLNKFIAHAGICARRDAAELVRTGKVTVNGANITEPGFKVSGQDEIKVNGKKIGLRKHLVYILLNKPKDYITTTEDPQGRKTVLDIVQRATPERVYPIGRLDRNTTGVLLLTNDGELAQKLSHPSYEVRKIYEVTLDKPLAKKDFDTLMGGLTLEDGLITPDALAYADPKNKAVIGIEIHSGRNRIVRRIFEHLGYDVRNLDRVMYANLTKKNVERGKWRFLSEKEVRLLKFLNASYSKKH